MALNSYALTTVARLKAFLEITATTYDTIFEIIINAITDEVENNCHRRFIKTIHTKEVVIGDGSNQIVVANLPIISTETFKLYEDNDGTWEEISSNDYHFDNESGIIDLDYSFHKGRRYAVDYTAGYNFANTGATLIPLSDVALSDLEYVVWKLCSRSFNNRKSDSSIQSMRLYNYQVTFGKGMAEDDDINKIINRYIIQSL